MSVSIFKRGRKMKALTHEDRMKNPTPRMMWVWDNKETSKEKRKVIYISEGVMIYPVIALTNHETTERRYTHCAEIAKTRRMTNKELSWWLSEKPHRELKMSNYVYQDYNYRESEQDAEVADFILIRENDGEWRDPFVEDK